MDLRDLGYSEVTQIPADCAAITSLITARDGKIYGGTSGTAAYLFVFEPTTNKVRPLGRVGGAESIHHALVEDNEGSIYLGTGKNLFEPLTLTPGEAGGPSIDELLWRDIKGRYRGYPGGHLYRYRPTQKAAVRLPNMDADVEDLGIPVPGDGVYALAIDRPRATLYGLTYPEGRFFTYRIGARKFTDLGPIDTEKVYHGPERDWRSLPRSLICDRSGRIFTSGTGGAIVYYCPLTNRIVTTDLKVPGDYNRVQFFKDHAVVECFAMAADGTIYGGSCDGYLFALDPAKLTLRNLGKPRSAPRVRCLSLGRGGEVYLMAGQRSAAWPCQAYVYHPQAPGFEEVGLLIVDRSPYYYWRGYQFDAMATGNDGTIYFGESDRRGHLFLYLPPAK